MHLVSLKPELEGLIVPSKFYGIAAAARPTIFIGSRQGEIAQLIEEAHCGVTIQQGDSAALLSRILELAKDPNLARGHGDTSSSGVRRAVGKASPLSHGGKNFSTPFLAKDLKDLRLFALPRSQRLRMLRLSTTHDIVAGCGF